MILVTGATGFIGGELLKRLIDEGAFNGVLAASRRSDVVFPAGVKCIQAVDLLSDTTWTNALKGVTVVVHLAARVHQMKNKSNDPLTEFRRVNLDGTANLARQAAAAGVRRFVYLSSIKVNGERTELGRPFTAEDIPAPVDPYGISKHEAEQQLRKIAADTGMDVVIIRSPLVYGPGVKANFEVMMSLLSRGVPLPLGAVTSNRRSLVALENLVDLIAVCSRHPGAANQTFLVSDGEDLSTAELLKRLGVALEHPARLFYLPISLLKLGSKLVNKTDVYHRLCGSLQLEISKTRKLLNWTPPITVDEGLRRAANSLRD